MPSPATAIASAPIKTEARNMWKWCAVKGLKLYTDNWYFDFYNSLFYGLMFSDLVFFFAVELFSIRRNQNGFSPLHLRPGRGRRHCTVVRNGGESMCA